MIKDIGGDYGMRWTVLFCLTCGGVEILWRHNQTTCAEVGEPKAHHSFEGRGMLSPERTQRFAAHLKALKHDP